MDAFDVWIGRRLIDTVFANKGAYDAEEIRRSLIEHDGYDPAIRVSKRRKPRPAAPKGPSMSGREYTVEPRGSDFAIQEYAGGFAIIHKATGKEHWLSDGVDMFFTADDEPISPGTKAWERAAAEWLKHDQSELYEAYFPELLED